MSYVFVWKWCTRKFQGLSIRWLSSFFRLVGTSNLKLCIIFRQTPMVSCNWGSLSCNPEWFPAIYSNSLVVSTPLKDTSQLQWLFPIYGTIKIMFQTTNQMVWSLIILSSTIYPLCIQGNSPLLIHWPSNHHQYHSIIHYQTLLSGNMSQLGLSFPIQWSLHTLRLNLCRLIYSKSQTFGVHDITTCEEGASLHRDRVINHQMPVSFTVVPINCP